MCPQTGAAPPPAPCVNTSAEYFVSSAVLITVMINKNNPAARDNRAKRQRWRSDVAAAVQ